MSVNILYANGITAGQWTIQATCQEFCAPVGIIWYSFAIDPALQIENVFVHEPYRRRGIAKQLHDALRKAYPNHRFTTGHSTGDGKKWLAALGYLRRPKWGWELPLAENNRSRKSKK